MSSLLIVVLLSCGVYIAASTIFYCTADNPCHYGNYKCSNESDCSIICAAGGACQQSTFICPISTDSKKTDYKCDVACNSTSNSACLDTIFYTQDSTFTFSNDDNQFAGGTLHCGEDSSCELYCGVANNTFGNDGMCRSAKIYAQKADKLTVKAMGQETLRYSEIYCPEEGDCFIDLVGTQTGPNKISNANIYISDHHHMNLDINCDSNDANACYGAIGDAPTLHCYNGTYSCKYMTVTGKYWFCEDESSPCNGNFTGFTTTEENHPDDPIKPSNVIIIIIVIVVLIISLLCCCIIMCYVYRKWSKKKKEKSKALLQEHQEA